MATMPTKDNDGRKPPAQPKIPNQRPAQPKAQKIKLATRDPRRRGG
jgi:hypothetical protein